MLFRTVISIAGGLSRRQFACAISSALMPKPRSVMSIRKPPLASIRPEIRTGVSAADSDVAFSTSSASRCTTSLTAGALTAMPGCTFSETRSYSSISDTAALITLNSAIGWGE